MTIRNIMLGVVVCGAAAPASAANISTYTAAWQQFCCGTPEDVNWYAYNGQFSTYFEDGVIRYTNEVPIAKTVRSEIIGGGGTRAESSVNFDITRGTIGAYIGTSIGVDPNSATSARSMVAMGETLTFTVVGANALTRTPISLTFDWHGVISGRAGAFSYFEGGIGSTGFNATRSGNNIFTNSTSYLVSDGGDRHQFTMHYDIIGALVTVPIFMQMRLEGTGGQIADFRNTAGIGFQLPDNVSFTSASGIFLTQSSAIPELSTWAMMIVGFGLVGSAARRRGAVRWRAA